MTTLDSLCDSLERKFIGSPCMRCGEKFTKDELNKAHFIHWENLPSAGMLFTCDKCFKEKTENGPK